MNPARIKRSTSFGFALILALLICGVAFAGYQSLFSSFAAYDDEGYVMLSLKSYLSGHPLYDETFTQYGPAYFQLNGAFHRLTDVAIDHDHGRFKTLFTWTTISILASWLVYQVSRNVWLSVATLPIVFFHLDRFGLEPAHPQDLCLLLTFIALMSLTSAVGKFRPQHPSAVKSASIVLTGMLVATICMIKINLGVFLLLSFALTILAVSRRTLLVRILFASALVLTLLMPLVLMHRHLTNWSGAQLPLLVIGSTIIAMISAWNLRLELLSHGPASLFAFLASVGTGVILFGGIAVWEGTTLNGLLEGIFLQHIGIKAFNYPPLFAVWIPATLVSGWCYFKFYRSDHPNFQRLLDAGILVLFVALLIRQLTESFSPILHGGHDRSLALLMTSVLTPFAWIVLIPLFKKSAPKTKTEFGTIRPSDVYPDSTGLMAAGRVTLCLFAVIQPLQSFPIPGTQVGLGSIGLVLILLLSVHDVFNRGTLFRAPAGKQLRRIQLAILSFVIVLVITRSGVNWSCRSHCVPLQLSGAMRMRLPVEQARQLQWVVAQIEEEDVDFFAAPNGYHSFYLWARRNPVTHFNATFWPTLLNSKQQHSIIAKLENAPHLAVIVRKDTGDWYRIHAPLVEYIVENFKTHDEFGSYQLWSRPTTTPAPSLVGIRAN